MNILISAVLILNMWSQPVTIKEPVGTYTISAYSYSEGYGENYKTAGGYPPEPYYTIATTEDYRIGEKLYIDGVGEVQVQDRGNFPTNRIDLHIGRDNPENFGLQNRRVYRYKKKSLSMTERLKGWPYGE